MHICVCELTIIGSDNGLSPDQRQATVWTIAGILFIGSLRTKLILIEIYTSSLKKKHLKMLFGKGQPSCLGLNVLKNQHMLSSSKILAEQIAIKFWYHMSLLGRSELTEVGLAKNDSLFGIYPHNAYITAASSLTMTTLIARFMGPIWGPSGADRTQVGPMLAPWICYPGRVKGSK